MARRKITQTQANQIKKRYQAIVDAKSDTDSLDKIQADFGISRTTIYDLRDKGWDIHARRDLTKYSSPELEAMNEEVALMKRKMELMEDELRHVRRTQDGG